VNEIGHFTGFILGAASELRSGLHLPL